VFTQVRITQQFGTGDIVMIGALVSNDSKHRFSSRLTPIDFRDSSIDNANTSLHPWLGTAFLLPH
jgi:hypothetical protein